MKTRIIVAFACMPILFIALMVAPPVGTLIFISTVSVFAAHEFMRAVAPNSSMPMRAFTMISAAAIQFVTFMCHDKPSYEYIIGGTAVLFVSGVFAEAIRKYDTGQRLYMEELFSSLFVGALVPWFLSTFITARFAENGYIYVMMPFFISMGSDTGGYFFGRFFGNTKAFPKVSPNKTIAGCFGGLIMGVVGAYMFGGMAMALESIPFDFLGLAVCGIIGSFASQLGDLAFSLIKRQYGIKDYGKILPGHGGALDRFDSSIFAAPIIFMTARILGIF